MRDGWQWTGQGAAGNAETWNKLMQALIAATPHEPIVVSKAHTVLNRVVDVSVGLIPDSQRRRRRSQAEAPVSATPALTFD